MPHLIIVYTPNIEADTDMSGLCRTLADAMITVRDEHDRQVFPTGGTRVLAYPAAHYAVADGSGDYGFLYMNLRIARGRSDFAQQEAGRVISGAAKVYLTPLLDKRKVGLTLNIDEGQEIFDAKFGNLHPVFAKN
jgi:5-carboxymethyl-2-hydroxymuconate isomerase